jgi:GntR family transcriptional regulator/MocR family aminotransferase
MAQLTSHIIFSGLIINRADHQPIHRQIYEYLRVRILQGQIRPGMRLPATRALATELGVSRNTVMNAYRQLMDEGYLEAFPGSDTRVTHTLPEQLLSVESSLAQSFKGLSSKGKIKKIAEAPPRLSETGEIIMGLQYPYWDRSGARPFSSAQPGVDRFPVRIWEKVMLSAWRSLDPIDLSYPSPLGYAPLRETLANYLQETRGVRCDPEQVIITNGAQQALSTTATLLLNKGDQVWVENPSYNGVKIALGQVQANIVPVSVDANGLVFEEGLAKAPNARMVCISPSHQYPLGVTMDLTRRLELLGWAEKNDAWIVEDDYDSEYRYRGYPLEALQGLDKAGRVIYVGTFSKVIYPAMRLGYMVVPKSLIEPFRLARAYADRGSRLVDQAAVNLFIQEGHMARHIRKMRTLYAARQAVLIDMAKRFLSGQLIIQPNDAGLHLVGWLPYGVNDREVSRHLLKDGIYAPPLSYFALEPLARGGLVMGYAAVKEDDIITAVKQMADSLEKRKR